MLKTATSAGEWLAKGRALLEEAGVPEVQANAEFLLADVLGCGRAQARALAASPLTERQVQRFLHLVKTRSRRIPLAYILGTQPFLGLELKVTPSVLIPRPETEELVEAVAALCRERFPAGAPLHILEIGTGTGCISIALAKRLPAAILYATEVSPEALALASENAHRHHVESRVRFVRENLFKPESAARSPWADLLVSNPPYIPSAQIPKLEPEVLREPFLALDGGKDGLDAIRAIVADAPRVLKPGGWLALEFGDGQAEAVRRTVAGFASAEIRRDFSRHERFVLARRAG